MIEPEGQKFLNRSALSVVFERSSIEALVSVNVDEDKRILSVEEAFVRFWDIACLDLVVVELLVRHLDQRAVHPVLGSQLTENCSIIVYQSGV